MKSTIPVTALFLDIGSVLHLEGTDARIAIESEGIP